MAGTDNSNTAAPRPTPAAALIAALGTQHAALITVLADKVPGLCPALAAAILAVRADDRAQRDNLAQLVGTAQEGLLHVRVAVELEQATKLAKDVGSLISTVTPDGGPGHVVPHAVEASIDRGRQHARLNALLYKASA